MFALKVGGGFQGIDSSGFSVKREEVFSKFFFKVEPVDEMKMTGLHFEFEFVHRPAVSMSCFHIQHHPHNLHLIVVKGVGSQDIVKCMFNKTSGTPCLHFCLQRSWGVGLA